jgi:hypothetical protein
LTWYVTENNVIWDLGTRVDPKPGIYWQDFDPYALYHNNLLRVEFIPPPERIVPVSNPISSENDAELRSIECKEC